MRILDFFKKLHMILLIIIKADNRTCAEAVLEADAGPYSMLWKISYTVFVVLPAIIMTSQ